MGADKNRQITPPSRFPRSRRARRGRFDPPGASGRSNPTPCGHRPAAGPGQAPPAAARQAPSGHVRSCSPRSPMPPFGKMHRHRRAMPAQTLHRSSRQVTLRHSGRKSSPPTRFISSPMRPLELPGWPAEPARAPRRVGRCCGQTFHGPTRACGIRRRPRGRPPRRRRPAPAKRTKADRHRLCRRRSRREKKRMDGDFRSHSRVHFIYSPPASRVAK